MKTRRDFVIANLAALPALAALATSAGAAAPREEMASLRRPPGPSAAYFPNVPVVDHTGRAHLWYDDLVRDRAVVVNFITLEHDARHGTTEHLARANRMAAERGVDRVAMLTVAIDAPPVADLASHVAMRGVAPEPAGPRWLFLTGRPAAVDLIRSFLFWVPAGASSVHGEGHDHCLAVARYGNEALARWASFPVRSRPESIAQRMGWI